MEKKKSTPHRKGKFYPPVRGAFYNRIKGHMEHPPSGRVVSRIGPVDKDKIWAEKSYSQSIFYPLTLEKRWL